MEKYDTLSVAALTGGMVGVYKGLRGAIFGSEVGDVWTWVIAAAVVDWSNGWRVVVGAIVVDVSSFNGSGFSYGEMGGTNAYPRPWFPEDWTHSPFLFFSFSF